MRIVSRSARKSFLVYQLLEHIMLTALTVVGIPMFLFIMGGKHQKLVLAIAQYATDGPVQALMVFMGIVVAFNVLLGLVRSRRLIVGLELGEEGLTVRTRGLLVRRIRSELVPFPGVAWSRYATQALFPITNYTGYRFFREKNCLARCSLITSPGKARSAK